MAKHNGTVVTNIEDLDGIDFDTVDTEDDSTATPQRPKRAKRMVVTILVATLLGITLGPIGTIPWCIYRKRQWRKICSSQ